MKTVPLLYFSEEISGLNQFNLPVLQRPLNKISMFSSGPPPYGYLETLERQTRRQTERERERVCVRVLTVFFYLIGLWRRLPQLVKSVGARYRWTEQKIEVRKGVLPKFEKKKVTNIK